MDEIVRHAGMIGIFPVDRPQDFDRLDQLLFVLVERFVQCEGIEIFASTSSGYFLAERLHRLLVVLGARVLVDLVIVLVELLDSRKPIAFTLGLGADRLALLTASRPRLRVAASNGPTSGLGRMPTAIPQ